jgi:hypothetical protein
MPYIYAKIYPKVLLRCEEDKITYRTFESLDEYILFVNFELPGLLRDDFLVVLSNNFCFT